MSDDAVSGSDPFPELRPQWNAILRIYDEFSRICGKHGLRFYVSFGSALGAVRHKGFIPWDDDMDVAMPREDYDRFVAVCGEELPSDLKWVDWKNSPGYPDLYGKIQETDRALVESLERGLGRSLPHGVFLDVFPLDGYPTGFWRILKRRIRRKLLRARLAFLSKSDCGGLRDAAVRLVGRFAGPFFDRFDSMQDRFRIEESIARSVPTFSGKYCCNYQTGFNELVFLFPVRCWEPPGKGVFEGRVVPLPGDCDTLLRMQYGDYMKLPPPEKRKPKHERCAPASWKYGPASPEVADPGSFVP